MVHHVCARIVTLSHVCDIVTPFDASFIVSHLGINEDFVALLCSPLAYDQLLGSVPRSPIYGYLGHFGLHIWFSSTLVTPFYGVIPVPSTSDALRAHVGARVRFVVAGLPRIIAFIFNLKGVGLRLKGRLSSGGSHFPDKVA